MRPRVTILAVLVMVFSVLPLAPASAASLQITVNYAGDWVIGDTDIGATVDVFLYDAGEFLKDDAVVIADGSGHFSLVSIEDCFVWRSGECPDIVPGDVVRASTDSGASAEVRVGELTVVVDARRDTAKVTLYAPWFTETLDVHCEVWNGVGPTVAVTARSGDLVTCDFGAVGWNLDSGQKVAVAYFEPDGDAVINTSVLWSAAPITLTGSFTDSVSHLDEVQWHGKSGNRTLYWKANEFLVEGDMEGFFGAWFATISHVNRTGDFAVTSEPVYFSGSIRDLNGVLWLRVQGSGGGDNGDFTATMTVLGGTGDFANMRGRGTLEGTAGVGGTYSLNLGMDQARIGSSP